MIMSIQPDVCLWKWFQKQWETTLHAQKNVHIRGIYLSEIHPTRSDCSQTRHAKTWQDAVASSLTWSDAR